MRKAITQVLFSNFFSAGLGFALSIFISNAVGAVAFGKYTLLLTISMIVYTVFDFGFCNGVVILLNKYDREPALKGVNRLYLKYFVLSSIIILLLSLFVKKIYSLSVLEYLFISLGSSMFMLYKYVISIKQAKREWVVFSKLVVLNNVVKAILIVVLFVFIGYRDFSQLISLLLIQYIFIVCISLFLARKDVFNISGNKELCKSDIISVVTPFGIMNLLIILSTRLDVILVEYLFGEKDLGVYAIGSMLTLAVPLITDAIMKTLLGRAVNADKQYLKTIHNYQKKYLWHVVFILILIIYCSQFLFDMFFTSDYEYAYKIFNVLLVAQFGSVFFTPLETYYYGNNVNYILKLKLIQVVILIVLSLILSNYLELISIAVAFLFSRYIPWLLMFLRSKQEYAE